VVLANDGDGSDEGGRTPANRNKTMDPKSNNTLANVKNQSFISKPSQKNLGLNLLLPTLNTQKPP